MNQPNLKEISQRLRYESFTKLANELTKADNFDALAIALGDNLKYILNTYFARFYIFYEDKTLLIEIFRSQAGQTQVNLLPNALEQQVLETNIPDIFYRKDFPDQLLQDPIYGREKLLFVYMLPVYFAPSQRMLAIVGSKDQEAFNQTDFRFTKLVADFLFNKTAQLFLQEKLFDSNEQLQEVNEELVALTQNLEDMVASRTQQLSESKEELNTLFYRASHDLRTPFTSIRGLMYLAKSMSNSGDSHMIFEKVNEVIDKADKMLNKLKAISENSDELQPYNKEKLKDLIHKTYDKHRTTGISHKLKLSVDLEGIQYPFELTDSFTNAMDCIMENAFHFMQPHHPKPLLKVSAKQAPDMLQDRKSVV